MSALARQRTARALMVAASITALLALVAGYARVAVIDSDQFANRATAALEDDSVKSLVAERVTDGVVLRQEADLLAARPIIESAVSGIIGSRAFTKLFRSAVRDVHRALFDRDQDTFTLSVADIGTLISAGLERVRPSLARRVESTGHVELIERHLGDASATLTGLGDRIRTLSILFLALSLVLVAAALAVAVDKRRAVVDLGIGLAAVGLVLIVAYGIARSVALDHVEGAEQKAAAGAVWDAFLGDLRMAAWILAGSGAVIAAATASLIRPLDLGEALRRAGGRLVAKPRHPALRALRGVGLVAVGIVVLVEPDAVLGFLLALAGISLIYAGVTEILRLLYRPPAPGTERPSPARRIASPLRERRKLVTSVVAAGVIAAAVTIFIGTGGTTTAAPATGTCDGHAALCDRPLDRVALPATHNSMSVPLPGWYSAEQDRPIADQLRDGIRGLLIDTHYADRLSNGRLRTYAGSTEQLRQKAQQDGVNPDAVDAAIRLRDRAGFGGAGKRGMYVCHSLCELGGTRLESVLDDLHDFLIANPGEILVVVNQDYVTPSDFVKAVRDAGLEDLVYRGPFDGDMLTLREMVDRDQRVLFLAENHAGAAPWYQLAYKRITEETPYTFPKVSQLTDPRRLPASCKPNRGPAEGPLFLVNHWISTDPVPLPSNAAKVNQYGSLLRRVRECERRRAHAPNLVAVNFYRRGDLFKVVDELNGVR
jgi:hypothetical protein